MTKLQLRILGGLIILFNLVVFGSYGIEGFPLLVGTVGVALLFELVLVKSFTAERIKNTRHGRDGYLFSRDG